MVRCRNALILLVVSAFAGDRLAASEPVTLVSAKHIYTVEEKAPQAEAFAFDARGSIVAVGGKAELQQRFPDATSLNFPEQTIVPGLIDAHGHLLNLGLLLHQVDLVGTDSVEQVLDRLKRRAKQLPAGAWLIGRGWDQNDWSNKQFPNSAMLDAAFPDQPVWLERIDGHAGWANSAALAKINRKLSGTWQPDGGKIERDAQGAPTGILIDGAMALVDELLPPLDQARRQELLRLATQAAARAGLTGVHDAGTTLEVYRTLEAMASAEQLPIRVYAMADGQSLALNALCASGAMRHSSDRLQMRAVKLYIDGALGSRGAALLAPYADDKNNSGLLFEQPEPFAGHVKAAMACGLQVNTHAIGDRGNRVVLDAYERALATLGDPARALRHRIEHAQILSVSDIPRFNQLGLIASMQPTHATSDMPWVRARIGALRMRGAYVWQSLHKQNVRLALGSDFPVESVNPWLGFYAAVARKDLKGMPKGAWMPDERLTRAQALHGFTLGAAYAGFAEQHLGSLAVGKRADFVVLDRDIMSADESELPATQVIATYIDGVASFEHR